MKKTILLLAIFLCAFETFSQIIIEPKILERSVSRKKSRTIRVAKNESLKSLNIAEIVYFDSDGDGIPDHIDIDDDNDGITDVDEEFYCRKSPFTIVGTPCDTDNDG
ncbi:MAG: hypothetical protein RQ864_09470, partial [Lutibacter sp.]|nr:hypothetical protein [Lutibacter sp.]